MWCNSNALLICWARIGPSEAGEVTDANRETTHRERQSERLRTEQRTKGNKSVNRNAAVLSYKEHVAESRK